MEQKIIEINWHNVKKGLFALGLGFLMCFVMRGWVYYIYSFMRQAAEYRDSFYLILSMLCLFVLNCIRTTPVYLGAILIVQDFKIYFRSKNQVLIRIILSAGIMILTYSAMATFSVVKYHFGMPALIVLVCISMLESGNLFEVSTFSKGVIIAVIILTTQTLTTVPALTRFMFGQGEIAVDIKQMSVLLGYDEILTIFSFGLFSVLLVFLSIIIKLVNDEYRLKQSALQREQMEKAITEARLETLELRTLKETQNLVHDLKTPLTTVQGLSSLCEMLEKDEKIREYQARITAAVDTMNGMISEILYEDKKRVISVQEILNTISAYVAINEKMGGIVQYANQCGERKINANRIRLVRAIINVIENASAAVSGLEDQEKEILVKVEHEGEDIVFLIQDNGIGISQEKVGYIWESGYSSKGSTGLGLSFTKSVIENHGGTIQIGNAEDGTGTCVTIRMREVAE